jgi:hypothetical protein
VTEEIREVVRRNEVVDADEFDVAVFDAGSEDEPSDTTEAVNPNLQGHGHCSNDKGVKAAIRRPPMPVRQRSKPRSAVEFRTIEAA